MARKKNNKSIDKNKTPLRKSLPQKIHPWRICPPGEHWVREHSLRIPPSEEHPGGLTTIRHAHCARNPSGKDQLYPDEIQQIAENEFDKVTNKPCPLELTFGSAGSQYDKYIAGWTQYWNDVFKPEPPLDVNLVKALVASESSFNPLALAKRKDSNSARGLTQITNETRRILGDEKGEVKDHYLTLTKEDLNDPNINICAGIRWLFHKRSLASFNAKRPVSWEEAAVAEYKSLTKKLERGEERAQELMRRFKEYLEKYKKCGGK